MQNKIYSEIKRITGITVAPCTSRLTGEFSYEVNGQNIFMTDNAVDALFYASKNDREVYNALTPIMQEKDRSKLIELWALVEEVT